MRRSTRVVKYFAPLALLALAACQSVPKKADEAPAEAAATTPSTSVTSPVEQPTASREAVAQQNYGVVYLLDFNPQPGWLELETGNGEHLYLNEEPALALHDLVDVEPMSDEAGEGVLVLDVNAAAEKRLSQLAAQHPNKRLALIVDDTLLAAAGYEPSTVFARLAFRVGTTDNAVLAARILKTDLNQQ